MPDVRLPPMLGRAKPDNPSRSCPAHRAWVRRHGCSVPGCNSLLIECAHVRRGGDGGMGLKPSDAWCISLCSRHHAEQHKMGEKRFEQRYGIDLGALAKEFARRSPRWRTIATAGRNFPAAIRKINGVDGK